MPEAKGTLELDVSGFNASAKEALSTMRSLQNGVKALVTGMANLSTAVSAFNVLASKNTWKEFGQGIKNVREWISKLPTAVKVAAVGLGGLAAAAYAAHKALQSLRGAMSTMHQTTLSAASTGLKTFATALGVIAAGVGSVSAVLIKGVKDAITFGAEMYRAAQMSGEDSTEEYFYLSKALQDAGLSAEAALKQIKRFNKEGKDVSGLFASPEDYKKAMSAATAALSGQAEILGRTAERFQIVTNLMGTIGDRVRTFFLAVSEQILPPLLTVLDALSQIDLQEAGASLGKSIRAVADTLLGLYKNNTIGETLRLAAVIASKEFLRGLATGAFLFVKIISDGLNALTPLIKSWAYTFMSIVSGAFEDMLMRYGIIRKPKFGEQTDRDYYAQEAKKESYNFDDQSKNFMSNIKNIPVLAEKISDAVINSFPEFDSTGDRKKLMGLLEEAAKTGKAIIDNLAKPDALNKVPKLSSAAYKRDDETGVNFKIIADSLAAVGGGGRSVGVAGDAMMQQLNETRKQTKLIEQGTILLEKIESILGTSEGGALA